MKPPKGRSGYQPGKALMGEPTPQSHPRMFSDEDIVAEVRYLIRLNMKYGSHELRTMAYAKLLGILADRKK